MRIKLWGVRGAIPTPINTQDYRERLVKVLQEARETWQQQPDLTPENMLATMPDSMSTLVGGETTCIEVRSGDESLIIDLGTGARLLGYDLMARGAKGDLHVLITQTHWDHIQGWPFFIPGYIPGNTVHFYSGMENCYERFVRQQHFDHFPKGFDEMMSTRTFHHFKSGESFNIGSIKVSTHRLFGPDGTIAYRIEAEGKVFIFASDARFRADRMAEEIEAGNDFFQGADLLMMDAQYSVADYQNREHWGRTAALVAARSAHAWNVERLVLIHHEPRYLDEIISEVFQEANEYLRENNSKVSLEPGIEGQQIVID